MALKISAICLPLQEVLMLILFGFISGWVSHLFSDMLTIDGVRLFCWSKNFKIRLVPKKLFGIKFNTGDTWEEFNRQVISKLNIVLVVICIIYPLQLVKIF